MIKAILILSIFINLLGADSFEEKMMSISNKINTVPHIFGGKEFGKSTWMFNVLYYDKCEKRKGNPRTKCILNNRKKILSIWKKRDKELLKIANKNNDKIVWVARQTFDKDLDKLTEKFIKQNKISVPSAKIPKHYRLPTLKEITKACYDKNLRKYFYGNTLGYNDDSFGKYFKYKNKKEMYLDFTTCLPVHLIKRKGSYYNYSGNSLVTTKYVKNISTK